MHHDLTLPDFPLCVEWMDCPPSAAAAATTAGQAAAVGSYAAVGTFNPAIEIWDLDVLDTMEPVAVLGGVDKSASYAHSPGCPPHVPTFAQQRMFNTTTHTHSPTQWQADQEEEEEGQAKEWHEAAQG